MSQKPLSAEMHPGPGFRVRRNPPRSCAADVASKLGAFPTPDISDLCNRLYSMAPGIRNVVNDEPLQGPACTVKLFPGDNLMVHMALNVAQPGDVIVIDCSGCENTAIIGDMIANKARARGIAGFIVDGLVRDLPAMQTVGLPVYARGATPTGPLHRGPGEINYPVSCGGIVVCAADIICADANGIVVVPQDIAASLLERLAEHRERTREYVAAVRDGEFSNRWVDELLDATGCELRDD